MGNESIENIVRNTEKILDFKRTLGVPRRDTEIHQREGLEGSFRRTLKMEDTGLCSECQLIAESLKDLEMWKGGITKGNY